MTAFSVPRPGMLATVRNRRGLVSGVEPFGAGPEGQIHLVNVEYLDPDGTSEDALIWEREANATVLEPSAMPDPSTTPPMLPDELEALVRATRWTALSPYLDPDGQAGPLSRLPVSAPFHGAIQVEDYQLVPLLKAMRMPRVSLLLADDVGLGKTIEAGLVLAELLIRRRVRRVLILCPASLRTQWQSELKEKFCLDFDIVDRPSTHAMQRRLGLDASPWRSFNRIITSYDYLKQPDVFERFLAASRRRSEEVNLPWDLLIVDEAHNLAPAPIGEDSDVARTLQQVAPLFEHRLFLTATPHNGHTASFTGLLESLDPVRFTRKSEALTDPEKQRVEQVLVRRLKREVNARSNPPRFGERFLRAIDLTLSPEERAVSGAFAAFRAKVHAIVASSRRAERLAGSFAVEILGKRLLSCPVAFADSWHRYLEGAQGDTPTDLSEVRAAERATREDLPDDREAEGRARNAARTVGAWLKPISQRLEAETNGLTQALDRLGLGRLPEETTVPRTDARFEALCRQIDAVLCDAQGGFRSDERLIVFTEYKTTLDYLGRRLRERHPDAGLVRALYGGMSDAERDEIKAAFNDPADPVRLLIATDAAAEGLNLQETARYLLHYDVPWNPARLEQRNGRLDRHGQARDVTVYHFTTNDDADLSFLAYVVGKVHTIREDLGSMGDVFDQAVERRLLHGEDEAVVRGALDQLVDRSGGRAAVPRDDTVALGQEEQTKLEALAREVDLDPDSLRETLDVALGLEVGRPRLEGPDGRGRFRLRNPIPAAWNDLVDDSLRVRRGRVRGALAGLVFDASYFLKYIAGRPVFRPEPDTFLLHLSHPVFHRILATFAQARFPGARLASNASRWTVRRTDIPEGMSAIILLTIEELGVNELRETFHHWIRTIQIPVTGDELGQILPHAPAMDLRIPTAGRPAEADTMDAQRVWDDVAPSVRRLLTARAAELTLSLQAALAADLEEATAREQSLYQSRQGELSALIEQTTLQRLEREILSLKAERDQGVLWDQAGTLEDIDRSIARKEEEVTRRRQHYEELRQQLQAERDRVLNLVLPRRFTMRGDAQLFPVSVEIRLPRS